MDAFEVLEIAFTKDVKEIRRAYSKLLAKYSPETDPEGFQRLRTAYEEALVKAKEEEVESPSLSPIDQFMKDFEENYSCYEKRLDLDSWTKLLERDICYNIESSKEVSYRILAFIMDNYNFPTKVWRLFNSYFSWKAKKDSLYSHFPAPFIDFVVYKINNESHFDYDLLKTCKDNRQDEFIGELGKVRNAIEEVDLYTASKSIKQAEEICPDHPSLKVLRARYLAVNGQVQEALDEFQLVLAEDEDNYDGLFYRGELYSRLGMVKEAYQDYKRLIALDPEAIGVYYSITRACISLKNYEEAIKYAEKLSDISQYRGDIRALLNSAYSFYIDSFKKDRESLDDGEKFKLADAYFKSSNLEESYNVLQELIAQPFCAAEAYSMYCRILMIKKDYELAYVTVCNALQKYEDNYELNFLKADILQELGKDDDALKQYDKAIEINGTDFSAYNNEAYIYNKLKNYKEGLRYANTAIELEPYAAHGYKNKAAALLGLELYEDCLEACEEALNKYVYLTEAYIIKMRAFIDINLMDEALEVFNRAISCGLKEGGLYYEKARALMYLKRYDEAIQNCKLALAEDENKADYHYTKALCLYFKDHYEEAKEVFEKVIDKDSNYSAAYFYIIKCLLSLSKAEEAIAMADKAIKLKQQHLDRFHHLKGLALEEQDRHDEAVEEYKKAVNCNPTAPGYYYAVGHSLNELNEFGEAVKYYSKYIELEPEDADGYVSISYSLYNVGRYQECIDNCDKAIKIFPDYSTAHQNKGWALYRLNRIAEAEKECAIALKLDGNNLDVLRLKLFLLRSKNLHQDALIVCDRILELYPRNEQIGNTRLELIEKLTEANKQKTGFFKSLFK